MTHALPAHRAIRASCLARSLGRHMPLSAPEHDAVAAIEGEPLMVGKGQEIVDPARGDGLLVIAEGWAVARGSIASGRTHAYRLYLPGEIVGLSEIGATIPRASVRMQNPGIVHRIARREVGQLFARHPRLAALLLALASADAVALRDHAVALAAMDGETRLKTFLLQLRARLHKAGVGTGDRLRVPLNQAEIGELTGMTPIYVNRLLRRWVHADELTIERPYFRLRARESWEAQTVFVDSFEPVDTSWFPETRAWPASAR